METAILKPDSPSLPDVNSETYPFDTVQSLLDRATFVNLYSLPKKNQTQLSLGPDQDDWFNINGGYGLHWASEIFPFRSTVKSDDSIEAMIGSLAGEFFATAIFGSQEMVWEPGNNPKPRIFDPWSEQSFALRDIRVHLGRKENYFSGYGVGHSYPVSVNGQSRLIVCGIGNLTAGSGQFAGMESTLALQGYLDEELGFVGNINLRIVDHHAVLKQSRDTDSYSHQNYRPLQKVVDDAIYLVMRGEKRDRNVRTEYGPSPAPGLVSLVTPAQMRPVEYKTRFNKQGDLCSGTHVDSRTWAELTATVELDILAPPGSPESPNDFKTKNVYRFQNKDGTEIGSLTALVSAGKSFNLEFPEAPGQPGMRYSGFGLIIESSGAFKGARGTLNVNSAIGVAPHALSMLNVLRVIDPDREFARAFKPV